MIFVGMSDDDADEVLLDLFDKSNVRQDEVDARQFVAGKGDAEIDHQPFAFFGRPKAIESAIHADLAKTA
jgi:hypothetical protein